MYGKFREHMTGEMLREADAVGTCVYEEIELCIQRANSCATALVALPALTESGKDVLVGANDDIYYLMYYWVDRLKLVQRILSLDEFRATLRKYPLHSMWAAKVGMI